MAQDLDFNLLPLGVSDFSTIRRQGLIYVDHTEKLADLAKIEATFVFVRPSGFGKSLLISAFKSLFAKGLEDFQGLAIAKIWKNKTYPVIHLDFANFANLTAEEFNKALSQDLMQKFDFYMEDETNYFRDHPDPSRILYYACENLKDHRCAVLLIDNYDAPLLQNLDKPEELKEIQSSLGSFYAVLKSESNRFEYCLIVGVCRVLGGPHFEIFNNYLEKTFVQTYNDLLGFTAKDLETYFDPYITHAAQVLNLTKDELYIRLEEHYGQYCFSKGGFYPQPLEANVLNPTSILKFLRHPEDGFKNYFAEVGGTSQKIFDYIKATKSFDFEHYQGKPFRTDFVRDKIYGVTGMSPQTFLWQAGYFSLIPKHTGMFKPTNKETKLCLGLDPETEFNYDDSPSSVVCEKSKKHHSLTFSKRCGSLHKYSRRPQRLFLKTRPKTR